MAVDENIWEEIKDLLLESVRDDLKDNTPERFTRAERGIIMLKEVITTEAIAVGIDVIVASGPEADYD
jgi:hypothetical protein